MEGMKKDMEGQVILRELEEKSAPLKKFSLITLQKDKQTEIFNSIFATKT